MSDAHAGDPQSVLHSDSNRPTSIDLTLELERELDNESLPNSPNPPRPQSLDTHVLASIVTQLRLSLEEVTKDRDTLVEQVAEARTREGGLKEALDHVTDKCIRMESDLENAASQRKEDEETISMLRTKVEESRRALMRLQTEKRMSVASNLSLDLSRPPPAHASLSGPPSARRQSFQPLTGTSAGRMGHRRISSVSDSGVLANAYGDVGSWPPPSPRSQHIPASPDATPTDRAPPAHNRRVSLLFGRGSVTQPESASDLELELLRRQLQVANQQLDDTKRDLVEIQEAREASELCVRALRTFIAENNVGIPASIGTGKPAPPPTHSKQGSTASRWGFRLWTNVEPDSAPQPDTASPASTPVQTAPSKFGALFTGRKSTSSAPPPRPFYDSVHQEPMFNGSDTSSLPDSSGPISPASEVPHPSLNELGDEEVAVKRVERDVVPPFEHSEEISVS
ncbi:hypothetical protein BC628DRAFT_1330594 [Trametes gibbosa]|nr:hypothetical protein BC628DRAFT_1330594 [Trametes gibbosa]